MNWSHCTVWKYMVMAMKFFEYSKWIATIKVLMFSKWMLPGTPWQPEFLKWAFNVPRGEACLEKWNRIPANIDILISHTPPVGFGDLCSSNVRAGWVWLHWSYAAHENCDDSNANRMQLLGVLGVSNYFRPFSNGLSRSIMYSGMFMRATALHRMGKLSSSMHRLVMYEIHSDFHRRFIETFDSSWILMMFLFDLSTDQLLAAQLASCFRCYFTTRCL